MLPVQPCPGLAEVPAEPTFRHIYRARIPESVAHARKPPCAIRVIIEVSVSSDYTWTQIMIPQGTALLTSTDVTHGCVRTVHVLEPGTTKGEDRGGLLAAFNREDSPIVDMMLYAP